MSSIGVVIAVLLIVYVMVWAVRESTVAPASVTLPRPLFNRPKSVLSEPDARTADREELRGYFLQGRPDALRRVFP